MAAEMNPATFMEIPCCPPLEKCDPCDTLDFRYRLPFRPRVGRPDQRQPITVEVTLVFRFERCPGPLALGDILYSTTLLPGEQVRLFTSDRHTRYSFDSETNLAYRHETTSEESYYVAGMANAMSDLSILENVNKTSSFSESSVSGGGGAGINLGFVEIGGSVSGGSHSGRSASTLAHSLTQHAQSSSRHVEVGTRAASSTSIGEVESRTHTQSESENQFESASRVFSNPNRCHALTFFFYKINKCQTVRFTLIAVERRVVDPAAPTGVALNPPDLTGGVSVIPHAVLATSDRRLAVERQARTSILERLDSNGVFRNAQFASAQFGNVTNSAAFSLRNPAQFLAQEPIPADVQRAALEAVDKELIAEGLITDVGGDVSPEAQKRFGWERTVVLPTPGVIVKGCLDDCDICEPSLDREIALDLERKQLENELLKKQIELLDQSQEYRCCPAGSAPV